MLTVNFTESRITHNKFLGTLVRHYLDFISLWDSLYGVILNRWVEVGSPALKLGSNFPGLGSWTAWKGESKSNSMCLSLSSNCDYNVISNLKILPPWRLCHYELDPGLPGKMMSFFQEFSLELSLGSPSSYPTPSKLHLARIISLFCCWWWVIFFCYISLDNVS